MRARFVLFLACSALVVALWPALTGDAILGFRDMLHNYGPLRELVWSGRISLWNDREFGGASALGAGIAALDAVPLAHLPDATAKLVSWDNRGDEIFFRVRQAQPGYWILAATLDTDWATAVDGDTDRHRPVGSGPPRRLDPGRRPRRFALLPSAASAPAVCALAPHHVGARCAQPPTRWRTPAAGRTIRA